MASSAPGSLYGPSAAAFFKELKELDSANGICIDCGTAHPLWASLSYGTYFCLECSGVHRSLGVHLSFVRSINMDSWTLDQQARMRHGGNTAFARYMHSCGMPEALQTGGAEAIREKYNTESAAAYRAHLASVARGEPSELQPVPYAPPPPPKPRERPMSGCGPRADASSMQGFGSNGSMAHDTSSGGLEALMASLGSFSETSSRLTSAVSSKAAAAAQSASSVALPALGSIGAQAKRAAAAASVAAKGQLEALATFDAKRDLAHLSARGGADGESSQPQPQQGLSWASADTLRSSVGAVAGSVATGASWLWGRAAESVAESVAESAACSAVGGTCALSHPAGCAVRGAGGGGGVEDGGAGGGWGDWGHDDGWGQDDNAELEHAQQVERDGLSTRGLNDGDTCQQAAATYQQSSASVLAAPDAPAVPAADDDGWGDGWGDDLAIDDDDGDGVQPQAQPQVQPHAQPLPGAAARVFVDANEGAHRGTAVGGGSSSGGSSGGGRASGSANAAMQETTAPLSFRSANGASATAASAAKATAANPTAARRALGQDESQRVGGGKVAVATSAPQQAASGPLVDAQGTPAAPSKSTDGWGDADGWDEDW